MLHSTHVHTQALISAHDVLGGGLSNLVARFLRRCRSHFGADDLLIADSVRSWEEKLSKNAIMKTKECVRF